MLYGRIGLCLPSKEINVRTVLACARMT
uniref:Uncharacterized protein n=1 Tax=Anguilla anguilla TaxID=7936 RepID=A0A0E9VB12_ANGAN